MDTVDRIQMKLKRYSDLQKLETFQERCEYLKLDGIVGDATFGHDRYLNQAFYKSDEWKRLRRNIIIRDCGCDLGVTGLEIPGRIIIHHMNPISSSDLINVTDLLLNPEYLICTSFKTHNYIHYGVYNEIEKITDERKPNDTCPWKK